MVLGQHSADCLARSVGGDDEWLVWVRVLQHGCAGDSLLEGRKRRLLLRSPNELDFLLQEFGEWGRYVGVLMDELAVVACQSKEGGDYG